MSEDFGRIASALERIADSLEKKWHIDIDHGHIEKIDNIEHGDIDTHTHSFKPCHNKHLSLLSDRMVM